MLFKKILRDLRGRKDLIVETFIFQKSPTRYLYIPASHKQVANGSPEFKGFKTGQQVAASPVNSRQSRCTSHSMIAASTYFGFLH